MATHSACVSRHWLLTAGSKKRQFLQQCRSASHFEQVSFLRTLASPSTWMGCPQLKQEKLTSPMAAFYHRFFFPTTLSSRVSPGAPGRRGTCFSLPVSYLREQAKADPSLRSG